MNEYLLSVIGTVLLSALVNAVLPEGKTSPIIKAVSRLICLIAIIAPVLRFFQKQEFYGENLTTFFEENVIDEQDGFITYYSELRIREAETALSEELSAKFSIIADVTLHWEPYEEKVGVGYGYDALKITKIEVKCQECPKEVKDAMSAYLRKNYCSEVKIE